MQRIRLTYTKEENLKFISHKELIRAIEKAIRRADLPIAHSQGYNPHMKIDFGIPLQLGVSSNCELIDLYFNNDLSPNEAADKLNKILPPGIKIIKAEKIDSSAPSIQSSVKAARYLIKFRTDPSNSVKKILNSKDIQIIRKTKSGEKKINIRPLILDIKQNKNNIEATLQSSSTGTLKISEFVTLFEEIEANGIKRVELIT